jgi:predicted nucleic acid-binding protein
VLDANALIGFFEHQAGTAKKVQDIFEQALHNDTPVLMSAVTWAKFSTLNGAIGVKKTPTELRPELANCHSQSFWLIQERATRAGAVKQKHGLGYADSFAAELAIERSAWLVTADREFEKLGRHLFTLLLPRR